MKTITRFEFSAYLFIAFGLLFKLMHWPFGGVLTVLGLSSLSIVYFLLGQKMFLTPKYSSDSDQSDTDLDANLLESEEDFKQDKIAKFTSIVAGVSLATVVIGILFKIQSWPSSSQYLGIGLIGLLISSCIGIYKFQKTKGPLYVALLKRSLIIGAIGLILLSISDDAWLVMRYGDHPEYIEAVRAARANPESELLWAKVNEEWEKMMNKEAE